MDNDKVCQKCVNFLTNKDDMVECDYEYFTNVKYENAILFVPDMFDCEQYEIFDD